MGTFRSIMKWEDVLKRPPAFQKQPKNNRENITFTNVKIKHSSQEKKKRKKGKKEQMAKG